MRSSREPFVFASAPWPCTIDAVADVLLVDDDPVFAGMVEAQLGTVGYRVTVAFTLSDADELLADRHFDALILDGLLDDGSGLEWLASRRANGDSLPVVFVSGNYTIRSTEPLLRELYVAAAFDKKKLRATSLVRFLDEAIISPPTTKDIPIGPASEDSTPAGPFR